MEDCPKEYLITTTNRAMDRSLALPSVTIEDIHAQTEVIEYATDLVDFGGRCQACGGLVVDLSTGKLYCGQAVPAEVTASNQRILQN